MRTFAQKPKEPRQNISSKSTMPSRAHLRPSLELSPILHLQHTIGNQALQRLLLPKLRVGVPGDKYEQEADRVAEQVMHPMEPGLHSQVDKGKAGFLQTKLLIQCRINSTVGGMEAPPSVHKALNLPGQPLNAPTRAFMESRFGVDFSQVRTHSDGTATRASRQVNAQAFTVGRDIVFGAGRYAPETAQGRHLLAHELTHVVQQGGEQLQRARTQARQGTTTGGTPSGQEKGPLSFLSTAHVALDPSSLIVHRQPINNTPANLDTTVGEVENLVDSKDYKGALEKLNSLDMRDLLAVVARLNADAHEKSSFAYSYLYNWLGTAPNKPTANVDVPRLRAAFDAAPTRTLRNPEPGIQATNPTVSGYRKRPGSSVAVARPGDWGEDPVDNTWIAHPDPDGIRTYWGTNVAKEMRTSTWLANNPGNFDYKKGLTKRAIGSFHWGRGPKTHDFAVYFSETDAAADLREYVVYQVHTSHINTMMDYIKIHDQDDPQLYLTNMKLAVPELNGSDATTLWTGNNDKWRLLMKGFKSAEGWVVGTTVTKANVAAISTDPKDAALVDYYKTLVGAP